MCDLNWCPVCEKSISCESDSLYCSMACFTKDANRHLDHDFSSFLAPKICSLTYNNTLSLNKEEDDLPELANSIYTNSTYSSASSSSSSIFTRRAALLARTKHLQQEDYHSDEEEEEEMACCDYCDNLNKKTSGFIPTSIKLNKPYYVLPTPTPPLLPTASFTTYTNNKNLC